MTLKELVTRLANRLKVDEKAVDERGVSIRQRLIDIINEAYLEVGNSHDWEFLKKTGEIQTIPNYATGTVNVTTGSNTVTGTGTGWTSSLQGRYFRISTSDTWYRIASVDVSGQVIYLQSPLIEGGGSGLSYAIWKRYYYLDSEVSRVIDFESYYKEGVLIDYGTRFIQDITRNPSNTGQPIYYSMFGVDQYVGSYSDGTCSIAKDSNVVNGSNTLWLNNVKSGEILKVGSIYLRVKRIETNTRIISYNFATVDLSSPQTYTITPDKPIGVQLYYSADKVYNLPFMYLKKVFFLLNDNDRTEFPEIFDLAILDGGEANYLRSINSPSWTVKLQEYAARIIDLKNRGNTDIPRYKIFSPYIPTRKGY